MAGICNVNILHIWLSIGSGTFFAALGLYGWQQRRPVRCVAAAAPDQTRAQSLLRETVFLPQIPTSYVSCHEQGEGYHEHSIVRQQSAQRAA